MFGVQTRYLRTICSGVFRDTEDDALSPLCCSAAPPSSPRHSLLSPTPSAMRTPGLSLGRHSFDMDMERFAGLPEPHEVFVIWEGGAGHVYAWLEESTYDTFSTTGEAALTAWLSEIVVPSYTHTNSECV